MRKSMILSCSMILLSMATSAYAAPPLPSSPYMATTVKDFVAACLIDEGGCANRVGNVLMNKIDFFPVSHICISSPDYAEGLLKWLGDHPETASMKTEDGIYLALETVYTC